jgi:hypothetical protein
VSQNQVASGRVDGTAPAAEHEAELEGRRRAARRTATLLAVVVFLIYVGSYVLEALR